MNYDRIAELVHEMVRNPNNLLTAQEGQTQLPPNELKTVQGVFTKLETSGDVLGIETLPFGIWI